jgi:hypothetical protein
MIGCAAIVTGGLLASAALAEGEGCGTSTESCFVFHKTPGCSNAECCKLICETVDPFCCDGFWDIACVEAAAKLCENTDPGETCANPFTFVDGLNPFTTVNSTTDGPEHGLCNFFGDPQTHNDIWAEYVATATGEITIDTCDLVDYDSKIALYEAPASCETADLGGALIACNDDGPGGTCFIQDGGPAFATLLTANVVQGQTYLIRVGGFSAADLGSGDVRIGIVPLADCPAAACPVVAGNVIIEDEPCGENTNGGCQFAESTCCAAQATPGCDDPDCQAAVCACDPFCCDTAWDLACSTDGSAGGVPGCGAAVVCGDLCVPPPPIFSQSVTDGDTVCGTAWADGNLRDTDWYTLDLTGATDRALVTWSVNANFPVAAFILNSDCEAIALLGEGEGACPTVATACVDPGLYRVFVAVDGFQGFPCPTAAGGSLNNYTASLTVDVGNPDCALLACEGSTTLTQQTADAITQGGVACAGGGITTANEFCRSYNLAQGVTANEPFTVNCVQFGVNNTGPDITVAINLYLDTNGGNPSSPTTDLALQASTSVLIPAGTTLTLFNAPFNPPVLIPANSRLVVEMAAPAQTAGRLDYGVNTGAQTGSTFLKAAACGINAYVTVESINNGQFATLRWVQKVLGEIGEPDLCQINSASNCSGDVNDSGQVDGADLGQLLLDFGVNDGCPQDETDTVFSTDLTDDGAVNGADLGQLLLQFTGNPCP